jgi:hypothetical protein
MPLILVKTPPQSIHSLPSHAASINLIHDSLFIIWSLFGGLTALVLPGMVRRDREPSGATMPNSHRDVRDQAVPALRNQSGNCCKNPFHVFAMTQVGEIGMSLLLALTAHQSPPSVRTVFYESSLAGLRQARWLETPVE